VLVQSPVHCPPMFYVDTNSNRCRPRCSEWTPYTTVEQNITDIATIGAGIVAIISGIFVLILACVRCKRM